MIKKNEYMLNEQDSLQDMIDVEKQLIGVYGIAMSEASSKNVRTLLKTNLCETAEDQYSVFKTMQENDYYQPKLANKVDIDEQANTFKTVQQQLGQA